MPLREATMSRSPTVEPAPLAVSEHAGADLQGERSVARRRSTCWQHTSRVGAMDVLERVAVHVEDQVGDVLGLRQPDRGGAQRR